MKHKPQSSLQCVIKKHSAESRPYDKGGKGGKGGGRSFRPSEKGGRRSPKTFLPGFPSSVWSKNKGEWAPWAPPLDPPLKHIEYNKSWLVSAFSLRYPTLGLRFLLASYNLPLILWIYSALGCLNHPTLPFLLLRRISRFPFAGTTAKQQGNPTTVSS